MAPHIIVTPVHCKNDLQKMNYIMNVYLRRCDDIMLTGRKTFNGGLISLTQTCCGVTLFSVKVFYYFLVGLSPDVCALLPLRERWRHALRREQEKKRDE